MRKEMSEGTETVETVEVEEPVVKKRATRRKKKEAADATGASKSAAPDKEPTVKKKKRKRRAKRKTATEIAPAATDLITLPINDETNIEFWSGLVTFLNDNRNRSFVIQLDGRSFSLGAD